jgi:hypothetical protein
LPATSEAEALLPGTCRVDRGAGESQPDHLDTALRQRHAIRAETALQMKDALVGNQGKLCLLSRR